MRKLIPYIMFLIITVQNLSAQTDTLSMSYWVDRLGKAQSETETMESCYKIAQLANNNDTIILFSQKALRLAEKLGNKEIETDSRILIGKVYVIQHNYDNGLEILNKALSLATAGELPLLVAKAITSWETVST